MRQRPPARRAARAAVPLRCAPHALLSTLCCARRAGGGPQVPGRPADSRCGLSKRGEHLPPFLSPHLPLPRPLVSSSSHPHRVTCLLSKTASNAGKRLHGPAALPAARAQQPADRPLLFLPVCTCAVAWCCACSSTPSSSCWSALEMMRKCGCGTWSRARVPQVSAHDCLAGWACTSSLPRLGCGAWSHAREPQVRNCLLSGCCMAAAV